MGIGVSTHLLPTPTPGFSGPGLEEPWPLVGNSAGTVVGNAWCAFGPLTLVGQPAIPQIILWLLWEQQLPQGTKVIVKYFK